MRRAAVLLTLLTLSACGSKGSETSTNATKAPPVLGKPADTKEAVQALGFPGFATKNTTRVGGADALADAPAVARAVYPGTIKEARPQAVTLVDGDDWRAAISAAQLMARPLRAPVLLSDGSDLPDATAAALEDLDPLGAPKAGDAQLIRIGDTAAAPSGLESTDVSGTDPAALAAAVDRVQTSAAGKPSSAVLVAPSDRPAFAMPAAAYAAKSGVPVLWASKDALPAPTRTAIKAHKKPAIYVLGPADAISEKVVGELKDLGDVQRIEGADPVTNAIAFARFADGRFGWNVVDPGHGLVFASSERPADAAAGAALSASGTYGPLLLVTDAGSLPQPLAEYLLDIQPGYDKDPVRGVYNHGWLLGDDGAISVGVQARIDALLEIQPVDPNR
jgi:predicted small lipoprotein YifL